MNAQPDQRSAEWHEQRRGRITGSRVGAILGLSPYQKPDDVLRAMVREACGADSEFTGNEATRYGEAHEADAIAAYESERGLMVEPVGFLAHRSLDWLGASPDGLVGCDGMIEVKCPMRARYTTAPAHYAAQMQLQMLVADRAWCDFVVWRSGEPLVIERHEMDMDWFARHADALAAFADRYRAALADPAPFLAPIDRADSAWRLACQQYRDAAAASDAADEALKAARATLLDLAPAGGKGLGVTVLKVAGAVRTDYAAALKAIAPDADLTPYRKAGAGSYRIQLQDETE